jgi:uncharacterized surface protein with fasciclin (FAS1) repeats
MKSEHDLVDTALAAGNFSTLAAALGAAALIERLKGDGPFTVFAPTDDAFAKLPPQTVSDLLQPENKSKLTAILTYHVVSGRVTSREVINLTSVPTLQGQSLQINKEEGLKINDANIIASDVEASNGVIHVIDTVLLPSASAAA